MFDFDLADLYQVTTKTLNQAVKRNLSRFPPDFMFQLTDNEYNTLQDQIAASDPMWSQIVTTSQKFRRKGAVPRAFTEQGVAMLSGILRSEHAINMNIAIMRAFVLMRQFALTHKELTEKLKELESRYDQQFKDVYDALNFLLTKEKQEAKQNTRRRIGFSKDLEEN